MKRSYSKSMLDATPTKTEFERSAPPETPLKSIFCNHPPRNLNADFNESFECPCKDDGYYSCEYPHPTKTSAKDLNLTRDYEYINEDGSYFLTVDDAEKFIKAGYHVEDVCMQEMDPKILEKQHPTSFREGSDIIEYPIQIEDGLRRYDINLRKEHHVIGESSFSLNRSRTKFISVGLSPTLEFSPIIKIRGGRDSIFFTPDQFKELIEVKENIDADQITIGDHHIYKTTFKEKIVYKFECRESSVTIAQDTYKNLFKLGSLIQFKLKVFESINFPQFYTEILRNCMNNKNNMELYDKITMIILSELCKDYKTSLLVEVINVIYDKISLDYNLMCLYNN